MGAGRSLLKLGLIAAVGLAASAASLGGSAFTAAALLAIIPVPFYLAAALWIDRFEPEPRAMLALAFLWGASVAVLVASLFNDLMDQEIGVYWSTVATAPLVEEVLKGLVLLHFFRHRKDEFDGVIDGLIYAAMVGFGFAFAENVDYYGRALVKEGAGGLAVTFTLRAIVSPFSHPLFTSATGIGLGLARQSLRPWVRRVAPPVGLAAAVTLHSLWNASASAGLMFFVVYAVVMLPALVALLVVAGVSLKFEGRIIRAQLAPESAAGLIGAADLALLSSVRGRLHASAHAILHGGFAAGRKRRAYHQAASELAFLRQRAMHDGIQVDAELERVYLRALGAPDEAQAPIVDATPDADAPLTSS
jgi:protease PrsW